jgi:hypothetical protein
MAAVLSALYFPKKLHFATLPEGLVIITLSDCLVLYNRIVFVEALEELRINYSY